MPSSAPPSPPTITQTLNPGTRTASVGDFTITAANYSHAQQTATGTMTPTVDDSTGSGAGANQPRPAGAPEPGERGLPWASLGVAALLTGLVLAMAAQLLMRVRAQRRAQERERNPFMQDLDRWRGQRGQRGSRHGPR